MQSTALHTKEITTAQVSAVTFGFFSDEEIRKISVKQVVSPIIFDNLKNPIKGGLYDAAYGPMDMKQKCATCGLSHFECPGHFGHIDLAVPLYNPLVFITLYKLLRTTCLHCFKFRMAGAEVERFRRRLELLATGQLAEAESLVVGTSAAARKSGGDMIDEAIHMEDITEIGGKAMEYDVAKAVKESKKRANNKGMGPRSPALLTAQTLESMIDTIGDFFKRQPTCKCNNCGAHNPTIKREGYSKLFMMPLSAKKRAANQVQSTPILSVLSRLAKPQQEVADVEAEIAAGLAEKAAAGKKRRREAENPLFDAAIENQSDEEEEKKEVSISDAEDSDEDVKVVGPKDEDLMDEDSEEASPSSGAGAHKKPKTNTSSSGPADDDDTRPQEINLAGDAPTFLTTSEVQEIMRRMWELNEPILALIYPTDVVRRQRRKGGADAKLSASQYHAAAKRVQGYQDFFLQTVPVAPNRFRPVNRVGDNVYEHPQNTLLVKILNGNLDILAASGATSQPVTAPAPGAASNLVVDPKSAADAAQAQLGRSLRVWLDLQNSLNALFDSSAAENDHGVNGIRQQLEKKEGLFRKNMMGKRVNFAARSVISPDVYLNGGEIGVPPYFASRLSYPERVTPWNVERLREAVIAGPGRNPGAMAVEDERGRIIMLRKDKASRAAVAKTLIPSATATASPSPSKSALSSSMAAGNVPYGGTKVVYRTMEDGDFMLTNRQPTLHKPGMMGHRARIMRAERTIRFHYANCATFNADFDGDEINLHLPQDHLGRAEGYGIVHADEQFFAPTDGKPLRGLIQDHIVAGTLLTMKDCFLTQSQYCQLVYDCIAPDCSGSWEVWMDTPAVYKPQKLWTGKQVFTAVLMHYTRDQLPCTLSTDSKVPADIWGKTSGEGRMHIWRNHLVAGCIDKATFGKHGLLHIFHELYGAERTSVITAAMSRLFTGFLQAHGFTCGISDVFLLRRAEEERADLLAEADVRALEAAAQFVGLPGPKEAAKQLGEGGGKDADNPDDSFEQTILPELDLNVRVALSERFRSSKDTGVALDMKASGAMHPLSSEVVKVCLPNGQAKPFRHNMMALMTVTGAKGSVVNFSQISCLLGQQELEGRRVPRMASGKTLPCFSAYDPLARSGGFIGDRFLTGLRPQEYYFHCMAGREGLVDTTVKTSRSGYLQRCLIKNLESLRVSYDCTVRDDCDGSIVQFLYGEDGIDTMATGCLRTFPLLFYNSPQLAAQLEAAKALDQARPKGQEQLEHEAREGCKDRAKALLRPSSKKASFTQVPLNAEILQTTVGVTSEGFQDALAGALFGGLMLPPDPEGVGAAYKAAEKKEKKEAKKGAGTKFTYLDPMDFERLMHVKFYRSQAQPGEAVGVIAAQSVGEPSTQMTLNTFHMAGRGEANVTLGIPRLREILMTAAASIKTPVMTLPLREELELADAQALAVRLKRIKLAEALKGLRVEENVVAHTAATGFGRGRIYTIYLQFHPPSAYPAELNVTFDEISACFTDDFVPKLQAAVRAELKKAAMSGKSAVTTAKLSKSEEGGAKLTSEAAAPSQKKKKSEKDDEDENEEENEEYREGKLRFSGGHGEQATYGAGDDEDVRIEKASRAAALKRTGENADSDSDGSDSDNDDNDNDGNAPTATIPSQNEVEPSKAGTARPRAAPVEAMSGVDEEAYACEATVTVPLDAPKILMRELAERVAANTIMRGVKNIAKCYVLDAAGRSSQVVQTDGINIHGAWESFDLLDVDKLTTNNPASMLAVYGVEAARATVVKEVTSVFGAYGIGVDPRHLSLIADHMTHVGGYRACNRIGIESSTSPFLKISFETAASFLVAATLHGEVDPLTSPAARIVLGRPVGVGTGSMELVQRLGGGSNNNIGGIEGIKMKG